MDPLNSDAIFVLYTYVGQSSAMKCKESSILKLKFLTKKINF